MKTNPMSWDDYFMNIAALSAHRSKDPNTNVGCCIVNPDKRIVGIGYNGLPAGCKDEDYPWAREGELLETKYPYVVHAEVNAVLNSTVSLKNCTAYVTLFHCNECAKVLIQSGVKEIVFLSDKYNGTDSSVASRRMLSDAGIQIRRHARTRLITVGGVCEWER